MKKHKVLKKILKVQQKLNALESVRDEYFKIKNGLEAELDRLVASLGEKQDEMTKKLSKEFKKCR